MSVVGAIQERGDRPAIVRFERKAMEDKAESLKQNRYVAKDVDFALITPPYSRDVVEVKVEQWLINLDQDVKNNRIPPEWADRYKDAYSKFQGGQEIPLNGTAIRGWGVISPAQQETMIRMNVLTVEDLAGINDEGMKRIGMGALEMKNKAIAWVKQLNDKGPLTMENSALKSENTLLKSNLETLTRQVEELKAMIKPPSLVVDMPIVTRNDQIAADDILPEPEKPTNKHR
jgi:hypothetical protein